MSKNILLFGFNVSMIFTFHWTYLFNPYNANNTRREKSKPTLYDSNILFFGWYFDILYDFCTFDNFIIVVSHLKFRVHLLQAFNNFLMEKL